MTARSKPPTVMALVWGLVFVNLFMRAVSVLTWALAKALGWS